MSYISIYVLPFQSLKAIIYFMMTTWREVCTSLVPNSMCVVGVHAETSTMTS
jgi:hypothetical protein